MYLSKLTLNPGSRAVQRDLLDCQQLHRTIMSAFPDVTSRDHEGARGQYGVLHRVEVDSCAGEPILYVQSHEQPDWSRLAPDYLLFPAACKPVAKLYHAIQAGQVLRFRLQANPTRKVDTKSGPDGRRRNGRRVPLGTEEDLVAWLERKAAGAGFALLHVAVHADGALAEVVGAHIAGELHFRPVLYEGQLRVTEADRFRNTLAQGLGSAKAYGFGLLSVAPD